MAGDIYPSLWLAVAGLTGKFGRGKNRALLSSEAPDLHAVTPLTATIFPWWSSSLGRDTREVPMKSCGRSSDPDFNGDLAALDTVLMSQIKLNHNTETIARLYRRVRPDAVYQQSMAYNARQRMIWFGGDQEWNHGYSQTLHEVVELMKDPRGIVRHHDDCQYLQPHARRLPVERT